MNFLFTLTTFEKGRKDTQTFYNSKFWFINLKNKSNIQI